MSLYLGSHHTCLPRLTLITPHRVVVVLYLRTGFAASKDGREKLRYYTKLRRLLTYTFTTASRVDIVLYVHINFAASRVLNGKLALMHETS
jgi:hypothetical protein